MRDARPHADHPRRGRRRAAGGERDCGNPRRDRRQGIVGPRPPRSGAETDGSCPERRPAAAAPPGRRPASDHEARERAARRAVTAVALLDVNVLVALFDPDHIHHDLAHDWFAEHRGQGWATCVTTENGLVRVLTNPGYSTAAHRPKEIIEGLHAFRASGHHHFWAEAVSIADARLFNVSLIRGHRQVTDIYLL